MTDTGRLLTSMTHQHRQTNFLSNCAFTPWHGSWVSPAARCWVTWPRSDTVRDHRNPASTARSPTRFVTE